MHFFRESKFLGFLRYGNNTRFPSFQIFAFINLAPDFNRTGAIAGTVTDKALEQKMYKLHEELTDLHRKRGEVMIIISCSVLQWSG